MTTTFYVIILAAMVHTYVFGALVKIGALVIH